MAEAERLFAEALAMRKSSDIAANLAQSELEQQKFRKAAEHFSWALANLLPSASDAQRKAVETGLARSRTEVAVLRLDREANLVARRGLPGRPEAPTGIDGQTAPTRLAGIRLVGPLRQVAAVLVAERARLKERALLEPQRGVEPELVADDRTPA